MTSVRFVIREGRPVIAQLRVTPYRDLQWSEAMDIPPQGLTTSDLRQISIRWDDELHKLVADLFSDLGVAIRRTTAPKHAHKDDDFYAEKAIEYLEALHRSPRRPLAWLEEQYRAHRRKQWVTREQIRDWVHGARVRGFLTAGSRGRAGAEPTERLEGWARARKLKLQKPRKQQGGKR